MNARDRVNQTLSFQKAADRGPVLETFQPWTLTIDRFLQQGLPPEIGGPLSSNPASGAVPAGSRADESTMQTAWGQPVFAYESWLGFDPLRRISFTLPFRRQPGRISDQRDWLDLLDRSRSVQAHGLNQENGLHACAGLAAGHAHGDFSLRLNLEGFFWIPRELLGIEPHLYAFYDQPELLHAINQTALDGYVEKLTNLLRICPVDVVYIMEDLSGKNGPMISPTLFDAFIAPYYRQLVPVLKQCGVRHIFVDTDGDFSALIPNFIEAGIEGFLPLDVNAGIDIVQLRQRYPQIKLIGGFNKLCLIEGRDAVNREFERILPVIRQGGYIPGNDHQVAPATPFETYRYYIDCLKVAMRESGRDA